MFVWSAMLICMGIYNGHLITIFLLFDCCCFYVWYYICLLNRSISTNVVLMHGEAVIHSYACICYIIKTCLSAFLSGQNELLLTLFVSHIAFEGPTLNVNINVCLVTLYENLRVTLYENFKLLFILWLCYLKFIYFLTHLMYSYIT